MILSVILNSYFKGATIGEGHKFHFLSSEISFLSVYGLECIWLHQIS